MSEAMTKTRAQFTGLVVEDEWLLRMELVDELQAAGWKTLEAATGDEALALLARGERMDFLVTDIRLPGAADGWTVAERFRSLYPQGAVVYVSANPDLPSRRVAHGAFIGKPCDMRALLAVCDRLVIKEPGADAVAT